MGGDPNATYSSNCSSGLNAMASEFQPHKFNAEALEFRPASGLVVADVASDQNHTYRLSVGAPVVEPQGTNGVELDHNPANLKLGHKLRHAHQLGKPVANNPGEGEDQIQNRRDRWGAPLFGADRLPPTPPVLPSAPPAWRVRAGYETVHDHSIFSALSVSSSPGIKPPGSAIKPARKVTKPTRNNISTVEVHSKTTASGGEPDPKRMMNTPHEASSASNAKVCCQSSMKEVGRNSRDAKNETCNGVKEKVHQPVPK